MSELDIFNVGFTEPKRKIGHYSYTIYGRPKFGKSGFASKFPNTLFFGFEQGQNALRLRLVQVPDWKFFKKKVNELYKGKEKGMEIPYQNFVIDTADVAWKYCTDYVCKKNGWSDPSDEEWGKGWRAVADEFWSVMDTLFKLGTEDDPTTVIFIAHHAEKEFRPKNKPKYDKIVPDLPKGARSVVVDKVDFVIFCDVETVEHEDGTIEEKRVMFFRDNGEYEAGSRLRYFPEKIDFGDSPDEAFENFKKAFEEAIEKEFGEKAIDKEPAEEKSKPKNNTKEKEKTPKKQQNNKQKEEKKEDKNVNLSELKKELEDKFMTIYKSGKKSPAELVKLIKDNAGVEKISEIKDVEGALKVKKALEG